MNWSPKAGIPDPRIPDSLPEQSQSDLEQLLWVLEGLAGQNLSTW